MNLISEEHNLSAWLNILRTSKIGIYEKPVCETVNGDIVCPACQKSIFRSDPYFRREHQCRHCGFAFALPIIR